MSGFMELMRHGIKREGFEISRRTVSYLIAFLATGTLIVALHLILVSRTAVQGRRIEQLREDLYGLEMETEQLAVEIAEASSILKLLQRVEELDLSPAQHVEFLSSGERP